MLNLFSLNFQFRIIGKKLGNKNFYLIPEFRFCIKITLYIVCLIYLIKILIKKKKEYYKYIKR
jgi:hypothetical protein